MFEQAAKNGLTGFTLYPTSRGDWQAASRWKNSEGWRCFVGKTADEAVRAALFTKEDKDVGDLV